MAAVTPVKHVVVDAGGFIRNAPVREIGEEVYTVPEVVQESCDKATRQRLQVLPYTLNFKKPSAEAILAVSDFAKKTGDYRNLSLVDISVLALTYMLEKQHEGTTHIRTAPVNKAAEYIVPNKNNADKQTKIAGFYMSKTSEEQKASKSPDEKTNEDSSTSPEESAQEHENAEKQDESESQADTAIPEVQKTEDMQADTDTAVEQSGDKMETSTADAAGDNTSNDILPENLIEEGEGSEEEEEEEEDDDDDDGGWITPSNIKEVKQQMGAGCMEAAKDPVTVACLTTDFAMQNVLIQMGLNVVSVDGLLIKRAKSYVMRCYACMKITYNTLKVFCPNCGNKTLKRVAMTRDEDGQVHYYFSSRPLNTRGLKYPLPQPKGGKHANNPRLFEDQPLPQQRLSRKAKEKVDVFDPDYIAGSSPFAVNDVTSRASKIGITGKHDFRNNAYWNKRNPNEPRKRHGKKK
ncbi:RNA-binding protein NOB1-like [Littorina saxatilis]|uniref:RNA-binding protein NOB1 n=1 Tax=Littorina saxatilis TaxID=31220 RepID=A0AAN9GMR7_9CAEN